MTSIWDKKIGRLIRWLKQRNYMGDVGKVFGIYVFARLLECCQKVLQMKCTYLKNARKVRRPLECAVVSRGH